MIQAAPCHTCKCEVWVPDALWESCKRSRGASGIWYSCAYGHKQYLCVGESDEDKLRRERDRLAQQIAYKDDRIKQLREDADAAGRRAAAARGQVTKIKNRVGHGVCPCCNRTFENLARHMGAKHPTFTAEAAE